MNSTTCFLPIAGCLVKAEDILGPNRSWYGINESQNSFLEVFQRLRKVVPGLKELQSIASYSAAEINKFLADNGFSITLSPFTDPSDFGVASILDVLVEWLETGSVTSVQMGKFPAVKLVPGVKIMTHDLAPNPIATIDTKSGDIVAMTAMPKPTCSEFQLLQMIHSICEKATPARGFEGVIFPMIDYDEEIDISWLVGMECPKVEGTDQRPAHIAEAKQQTKFKMNEKGARVKSAAAMTMKRCCVGPRSLVIDEPFLCWITRKDPLGLDPIFVGHFDESNWKNPGDLGDM